MNAKGESLESSWESAIQSQVLQTTFPVIANDKENANGQKDNAKETQRFDRFAVNGKQWPYSTP